MTGSGFQPMVMGDSQSSSWGNYGMREMSSEPRAAINNSPAWDMHFILKTHGMTYMVLSQSAKDGLASLKAGQEGGKNFLATAEDDKETEVFAKFILAISNAQVALMVRQGFLRRWGHRLLTED